MKRVVFFTVSQRAVIYNRKGGISVVNTHPVGVFKRRDDIENVVWEWTGLQWSNEPDR